MPGTAGARSASYSLIVPESQGGEQRWCQGMEAHGRMAIGTELPPELWGGAVLPPLLHLPKSPRAEAMCHCIFSNSAKLCLREVKDKSPEVYMFDSHLTRQLSAARGNTAVQISSRSQRLSFQPYSHFACLVVGALGKSVNDTVPTLLAGKDSGTSTLGK